MHNFTTVAPVTAPATVPTSEKRESSLAIVETSSIIATEGLAPGKTSHVNILPTVQRRQSTNDAARTARLRDIVFQDRTDEFEDDSFELNSSVE